MRVMFDSITAIDIPWDAAMVAGYVDGIYRWSTLDWDHFPHAVKVRIAISPFTNDGHVLDVETGDATPQQAPHWVLMRRAAGVDPTVYVNWSNWAATRQAFQAQQVAEPHYWLASYDDRAEVPAGTVAKQYANSPLAGGHYDLSAVLDYWPGVDPVNPNATAGSEVIVPQEVPMDALVRGGPDHVDAHGKGSVYLLAGNRRRYIPSPPAPLDTFRWVDQLAATLKITDGDAHHVVDIDWQLLELFPEDSPIATFPSHISLVGTLSA